MIKWRDHTFSAINVKILDVGRMVNVTKGLLLKWYVLYMCMLVKVIISKEQGLSIVVVLNFFAYIMVSNQV